MKKALTLFAALAVALTASAQIKVAIHETERLLAQTGSKTYSVSGGWLSVSLVSSNGENPTTVQVIVEENKTGESREAIIVVANVVDEDGKVK